MENTPPAEHGPEEEATLSHEKLAKVTKQMQERLTAMRILIESHPSPETKLSEMNPIIEDVAKTIRTALSKALSLQVQLPEDAMDAIVNAAFQRQPLFVSTSKNEQTAMNSIGIRGRRMTKSEKMTQLGRHIRTIRLQRHWSQDQLIQEMGMLSNRKYTKQYVSKVESGKICTPNTEFLQKLSVISGLSVEELRQMAQKKQ